MSEHAQTEPSVSPEGSDGQASGAEASVADSSAGAVAAVSGVGAQAPVVRAHDGRPVSDEMASAAAVAAVIAIRQVALAYAAHQSAANDLSATTKRGRAGFNAPRRNVRGRLPMTWTNRG